LYILDNYLQPVPIGVIGELYIGGIGLARGYLNRPDLTTQRFISDWELGTGDWGLGKEMSSVNGDSRLYKTGDLACYLPDGRIKLLGRVDNQVKIRGFRIEPQEVETVLCQHPGVRAGVVIVREDKPGEKRLVAYIVPNEEAAQQRSKNLPNPQSLRTFMREKLPEYLVPSAFVLLTDLPLTPNGKVDTHALPAPEQVLSKAEFIAPRTDIEAQLADIYAQILKLEKVSVDDDFFELGGHSLIATQLIAQALQLFQVELTVIDLFDAPTVAGMAERILQRQLTAKIPAISDTTDDEREEFEI
ncbi:non-ribosomal peptide synthetase, partial [Fischerella thermalis CCMEE 5196]